jgi:acyl-CoA synthetase (AMP-forming)/AMP-acid ligase II
LPISQLTAAALERARARASDFQSAGFWTKDPIDLVADAAHRFGNQIAVTTRTDEMTYEQLDASVSYAAGRLIDRGVQSNEPVLIIVGNSLESLIAIHAVLRIGGLALLVTASAGEAHVKDVIGQTSPRLATASTAWMAEHASVSSLPVEWVTLERSEAVNSDTPVGRPSDPDRPALVIFTSGTTSRPKGVIHSLNTMGSASRNYIEAASLTERERLFLVSPMASVTGVLQAITVPPMLGARVVLEDKWSPARSFELLLATDGTFFGGTDLLLNELLDEAERRGHSSVSIRSVFLGGAMLDQRILQRVEEQFHIVVMPAYGSSEAPISTAGMRHETPDVRLADDGRPLTGVDIRIGSSTDARECCISGPHLFLGYTDEEDDAMAFDSSDTEEDWFATGDLATMDGGRLKIIGRIKDIVIRKGMKIPIAEVEGMMLSLPGVRQAAGFGVADLETGEHLAMAVRMSSGSRFDFEDTCARLLSEGLAKWKLPEDVVVWDEAFPETVTGKVQRARLAEMSTEMPRFLVDRLRGSDAH